MIQATKFFLSFILASSWLFSLAGAPPLPLLHPLFGDHAVLQRGAKVPVWGWAEPGTKVTVTFAGQTRTATAGPDGKWLVRLKSMRASAQPRTLTVTIAGQPAVTIHDVLVGDVWLCSGQSNMEMGIRLTGATNDLASANFPEIRLLTVPHNVALEPQATVECKWLPCSPETVSHGIWEGFSAVGFYFGRDLQQELKIPIGLIQSAWGGTIAEAWTSAKALEPLGDFTNALAGVRGIARAGKNRNYSQVYDEWFSQHEMGSEQGWQKATANLSDWKTVNMPQPFSRIGLENFDGTAWFRHEFTVPENWPDAEAKLALGKIDDEDTVWLNGMEVGQTHQVNRDRNYVVPAGIIKPGTNFIAIRILDTIGEGGLMAQPGQMRLTSSGNTPEKTVALDGAWQMKDTLKFSNQNATPPSFDSNNPNVVTYLFNGMIAPLLPYAIKGAIWYQGESNVGRGAQYQHLLPAMIQDWRTHFGEGNFPFYIVQLANFQATNAEPRDHPWAELREAQTMTAKNVPHTGLAVAIDVGDAKDIHPKDKYTVGHRLALIALAKDYGRKVEYSGPVYRSMKVTGDEVRVKFDHAKGGLMAKGRPLIGFALAGEDGKFVWANAKIDGATVVLSAPGISKPVSIRYAWDVNPVCNLYNEAGLPAVPFRTDH